MGSQRIDGALRAVTSLRRIMVRMRRGSKTVVPVRLAQYDGETLVSRAQAKRLLARFDRFKQVVLDFTGVATIGQAFADEVFRVFQQQHPEVELIEVHANEDVARMISHARTTSPSSPLNVTVTPEMVAVIEASKAPRAKIAQATADLEAGRLTAPKLDAVLVSEQATLDALNRQWHDLFVQEVRKHHPWFKGVVNVPAIPVEWPPPLVAGGG